MLEYENVNEFENYCNQLLGHIYSGTYREFMCNNRYLKVYLKRNYFSFDFSLKLSKPYYSEIAVDKITSTNTSDSRNEIPSNFERVIDSVEYILEDKCRPISVYKSGDNYHILNGKHRFYAHILLKKLTIPVSIVEVETTPESNVDGMIEFMRDFYSDDGFDIAYPDKVISFVKENEKVFSDIKSAVMRLNSSGTSHTLTLTRRNNDRIVFNNCISAGNSYKSSKVACAILKECGFSIDNQFVEANDEFELNDKYDANNIDFQKPLMSFRDCFTEIRVKSKKVIPYSKYNDSDKNYIFYTSHKYICKYEPFGTFGTHFSFYSSFFVELVDGYYYIIGSESLKGSVDTMYILRDDNKPFINTTVKYITCTSKDCGNDYYELLEFLKNYK